MGVHPNIGFGKFPKQGAWLGKRCEVLFHYDTETTPIPATCVRDDDEEPGQAIFRLADGRFVLATECQHTLPE